MTRRFAALLFELARARSGYPGAGNSYGIYLAAAILGASVLLIIFNGPLHGLEMGGAFQRLYWLAVTVWLLLAAIRLVPSGLRSLAAG